MNENRINDNHFEKLLKEKADEFVLYPSKKIWFSIYNNMHPSKKWPSITICLLLLTTLFFIGNGNVKQATTITTITQKTLQSSNAVHNQITSNSISYSNKVNKQINNTTTSLQKSIAKTTTTLTKKQSNKTNPTYKSNGTLLTVENLTTASQQINTHTVANTTAHYKNIPANKLIVINKTTERKLLTTTNIIPIHEEIITPATESTATKLNNEESTVNYTNQTTENKNGAIVLNENNAAVLTNITQTTTNTISHKAIQNYTFTSTDKSWIEHDVLYNSRKPKKWKTKLYVQAYATPSISLRHLNNNTIGKVTATQAALIYQDNDEMNSRVRYTPSYGIETGIGFKYALTKKIKLKTGIQFNFSRYTISAFDNHHPAATSITIIDSKTDMPYQVYKSTSYSSKNGITAINLHNTTYQISIPIGIDYKIAGNENIQWYAGATLQPTLVLSGKNHLLSSDYKYYIKDNSLMNRFNLHAGLETFVTFTTSGINWQIGPQIRYQLFTTNTSLYNIEEKLTNVGLKIGITKKL